MYLSFCLCFECNLFARVGNTVASDGVAVVFASQEQGQRLHVAVLA